MSVIAIDGPGGSGKSTLAAALSKALHLDRLDTGAMYRAVALSALRQGIDVTDGEALGTLAKTIELELSDRVLLDGEDVTAAIRSHEVDAVVSVVAAHEQVRRELVARQQAWLASRGNGVIEGRDIGTVVAPDADLKIYLTADHAVRAKRRAAEHGHDVDDHVERIAEAIAKRDEKDAGRSLSPLVVAPDAITIDTSSETVADLVSRVLGLLKERST